MQYYNVPYWTDSVANIMHVAIAICSDSQAALKSLSAAKVTSALCKFVAETIAAHKELAIFNSIWLILVPGHSGISGSEEADRLTCVHTATSQEKSSFLLVMSPNFSSYIIIIISSTSRNKCEILALVSGSNM